MEQTQVIKKIKNLMKIKGIVEIAKFDTLQRLTKTDEVRDHHYEIADIIKEILSFSRKKYHLSTNISKKMKDTINQKKIWLFITMPSTLIKTSYKKLENIIMDGFNKKHDQLIIVGDPGIKFAKKNNLSIYAKFMDFEISSGQVIDLMSDLINRSLFDSILVVANTPKIKSDPYTILPIKYNKKTKKELNKTKFYHSLPEIIENITNNYVLNIIEGIYKETKIFFYKEKLVKHEDSLKTIEDKVYNLKSTLNKLNRKNETEEMIQLSQNAKEK